jgi:GNAT superfamily N-acetyltransferase
MSENTIREVIPNDIPTLARLRISVRENVLSNPDLITQADYTEFLFKRGKGWVCEVNGEVVGFSIVDLVDKNVWALFLDPDYEKRGIGRQLHDKMLDWYFSKTNDTLWLGTDPGTRAEGFYRKAGWENAGMHGKETKFEMPYEKWRNVQLNLTS